MLISRYVACQAPATPTPSANILEPVELTYEQESLTGSVGAWPWPELLWWSGGKRLSQSKGIWGNRKPQGPEKLSSSCDTNELNFCLLKCSVKPALISWCQILTWQQECSKRAAPRVLVFWSNERYTYLEFCFPLINEIDRTSYPPALW